MSLDAQDASRALADIDTAAARSVQLQRYRGLAPHLILWGAVWMAANLVTDLWPAQSGLAWLLLSLGGSAGSFLIGARTARQQARPGHGLRWLLTLLAIVAYQVLSLALLPPLTGRQQDAYISLLWMCLYVAVGAWVGWRLSVVGALGAALIVLAYFHLPTHFFLFMGCVTGGSLIVGGLWLRRA
jgi:hypothetical protein